jgi:hypothetical protein
MKKSFFLAVICFGVAVTGLMIFSHTAGAYALGTGQGASPVTSGTVAGYLNQVQQVMNNKSAPPGAPSWFSGVLNTASAWFQSIMTLGAQSTGAPAIPITISGPLGSTISVSAQNIFTQFDSWLYGIVHFHIALVVNFFFGLVDWMLGIARNTAGWLNSIFKSAAGK